MDTLVGRVVHYFNHLNVAAVELEGPVQVGDTLTFLGHTTDFTQLLCSIEKDHHHLQRAEPGILVAIKVDEPVRVGDQVYKAMVEGQYQELMLVWKAALEAEAAIQHGYVPLLAEFLSRNGFNESIFGLLISAIEFDPWPASPERLQVRRPYTSAATWMRLLQEAAGKSLLVEPEPGEFRLTAAGRSAVENAMIAGRQAMAVADPLPPEDSARLANLLERLVQASLFTAPPPDTWSIRLAYTLMPPVKPPLPFIEQAVSCLRGYRDDAHLAAWRPSGISGPALEALTLIWRDEAATVAAIYERLARRGFKPADYQLEVGKLRQRGLLEGLDTALALTTEGRAFREQVEQDTNRYFFHPWSCLSAFETLELNCLLMELKTAFKVSA